MKFNIGDKVFAKIKGYPPWPAKVVAINTKRYDVQFYGTGETGTVKDDSLFYYIMHKKKFIKSLKRKDYVDAIEEIEADIRNDGTDGNEKGEDVLLKLEEASDDLKLNMKRKRVSEEKSIRKVFIAEDVNSTLEKTTEEDDLLKVEKAVEPTKNQVSRSGRKIKVKRFSDDEDEEMEQKQKLMRKSKSLPAGDKKPELSLGEQIPEVVQNDVNPVPKADEVIEQKAPEENVINETESAMQDKESKEVYLSDVNLIPVEYLQAQLEYAMEVKKNENFYKTKPQDPREVDGNTMVVAKAPSGKLVGIRYKLIEDCDSEYDYVMDEEFYANDLLNKVNQLELGTLDVEEHPHLFETNLKFDEADAEEHINDKIVEWKAEKLKWLRNELDMIDLDSKITASLGLDKAEPKQALEHLNALLDLPIESLMLKKHPHVVDVVKRLRKYIGNVKEWNVVGDALTDFENDAKQIRLIAESIYQKFKDAFKVAQEKCFWDVFNGILKEFKEKTENLNEKELYTLWHEPDCLMSFVDRAYESYNKPSRPATEKPPVDEMKMDKENLSQVANSDNDKQPDL